MNSCDMITKFEYHLLRIKEGGDRGEDNVMTEAEIGTMCFADEGGATSQGI